MKTNNYQRQLDQIIQSSSKRTTLLLHACCAPCSTYVLSYLTAYFDVTLFWYNPNIHPKEEHDKRRSELRRLAAIYHVSVADGGYDPQAFFCSAKGLESEPEGGLRCQKCFFLRLDQAAQYAAAHNFDYFCTTLTISPHKNAEQVNAIGQEVGAIHSVAFLPSDFKKKNGYQTSILLCRQYQIYRQNYCGCAFSRRQES